MKASIRPGSAFELPVLETPTVDWGRPLVIHHQAGDYLVVRCMGHNTWGGRGQQKYRPSEWRLIVLRMGMATVLVLREPGRHARTVEAELKGLAYTWAGRQGRSFEPQLQYKDGVLSCEPGPYGPPERQEVEDGSGINTVVDFLVRSVITPWDTLKIKGRMPAQFRKRFDEARSALVDAHVHLGPST